MPRLPNPAALLLLLALALSTGGLPSQARAGPPQTTVAEPGPATPAAMPPDLDRELAQLFDDHGIRTAGVGRIRNGELVHSAWFGELHPGVATPPGTLFNVASITKVVAAETVLRLVARGDIDLDEPMSAHWLDPDLVDDPRHQQLTPRMVLTHTTGLPNWRFFLADRRLAFQHPPGTTFSYSGEGFEYLARFVEQKLGRPFDALVAELVLVPTGMAEASFSIDPAAFPRTARAYHPDGSFRGHFCRPNGWCREAGSWSAADDMTMSVAAMAQFLRAVAHHQGYPAGLAAERDRVHSRRQSDALLDCPEPGRIACPEDQGYGLGWEVIDWGDTRVISHGGSDWHELTAAYISPDTGNGVIVLLNAPVEPALPAMARALELLDPGSPLAPRYRRWAARAVARAANPE